MIGFRDGPTTAKPTIRPATQRASRSRVSCHSPPVCLFIFLMVSFDEKRLLILRKLKLSIYFLLWLLLLTSC